MTKFVYFELSMMMKNTLKELCPMLDLESKDRRIYNIADKDLRFYIRWLYRNKDLDLDEYDALLDGELEEKEVEDFIKFWTNQWWKKYLERTKVIIGKEKQKQFDGVIKKNEETSKSLWKIITPREHGEMLNAIAFTLIERGELCCLEILADNMLILEYQQRKNKQEELSVADRLNLLSVAMRRAKQLSYTHGPLVFIRYNDYKIREYRDTGETTEKAK